MAGFLNKIDAMSELIDNLTHAADRITDANNALKDSAPDDLGSDEIDDAGSDFQDRWEHGTGKIAEATEGMTEALRETQRAYRNVEDEIARLFPDGGGDGGSGGGSDAGGQPDSPIMSRLGGA